MHLKFLDDITDVKVTTVVLSAQKLRDIYFCNLFHLEVHYFLCFDPTVVDTFAAALLERDSTAVVCTHVFYLLPQYVVYFQVRLACDTYDAYRKNM